MALQLSSIGWWHLPVEYSYFMQSCRRLENLIQSMESDRDDNGFHICTASSPFSAVIKPGSRFFHRVVMQLSVDRRKHISWYCAEYQRRMTAWWFHLQRIHSCHDNSTFSASWLDWRSDLGRDRNQLITSLGHIWNAVAKNSRDYRGKKSWNLSRQKFKENF